jgi:hypothetical protein
MTQVYRTLRVAPSDQGVLGVAIGTPPMNLIGPELVRDLNHPLRGVRRARPRAGPV